MFLKQTVRNQVKQGRSNLLVNLFKHVLKSIRKEYKEDNSYTSIYYMQQKMLESLDTLHYDLDALEAGLINEIKEEIARRKELELMKLKA